MEKPFKENGLGWFSVFHHQRIDMVGHLFWIGKVAEKLVLISGVPLLATQRVGLSSTPLRSGRSLVSAKQISLALRC